MNARARERRIREAAVALHRAMWAVENWNALVRVEGVTGEDHGLHLPTVRERLIAAAEQLDLGDVYRTVDDDELRDLLG